VLARIHLDEAVRAAFAHPGVRAAFVGAPPGSGKSTWAAHFVRRSSTPSVWLRLDQGDADPAAKSFQPPQWSITREEARRITHPVLAVIGARSKEMSPLWGER
jgi:hypothetical protein